MTPETNRDEAVTGFRLSPQQRRLWLQQEGSRELRSQVAVRIAGLLDPDRLRRALAGVISRHASLRTRFRATPGVRVPIQGIEETAEAAWRLVAPQGSVDELFAADLQSAADPAAAPPLLAATLAAAGAAEHLLVLGIPALCADRASLANLVAELAAAYAGEEPPAEVTQYVQFSEWQHEVLGEGGDSDGKAYWQGQGFSGGAGSPARSRFRPERVAGELDRPAVAALEGLAAGLGLTLVDVLLGVWQTLLWRLANRPPLVSHLVVEGRGFDELQGTVGLLAKAVPMRCELDGRRALSAVLRQVATAAQEVREWQDSFAWEGTPEPVSLFETVRRLAPRLAGGVTFTVVADRCCFERFLYQLVAIEHVAGLRLELWYDAAVRSAEEAGRQLERLQTLLAGAVATPESPVAELPLLGEAERRLLIHELNRTDAEVAADRCVHELFAAQAARKRLALAVAGGGEQLTFAELDERANQLAHHLLARRLRPGARVGLALERSPAMVVGLLAILKAGAAYVPLDPTYPREHLGLLLADAAPQLVVTRQSLAEALPAEHDRAALVLVDAERDAIAACSRSAPGVGAGPDDLAYLIYTSGSTGRPKGVMVPHRGLVNYLAWCARAYPVDEGNGAPVHSPLGFDLTVTSLFAPLLAGRSVELLAEEQGVEALATALAARGGWSFVKLTPAHVELLRGQLSELAGRAAALIIGGEALLGETVAPWQAAAPQTRLINEYGPTETVVGCAVYEVPAGVSIAGPVPIGRPIGNARIYLLDAALELVPFGTPGQLYVGGPGVARGYHGNAAATAERFLPDPFAAALGSRLYATGDLARYRRADGQLEFLGRNDHQVKIRGFRVEPGEVEAVLRGHPGVRECAVLAREDSPGGRRLVAYLAAAGGSVPTVDELRRFLGERLPEHMVPAAFVVLDVLPLTANGKLNRAALPAPGPERPELEQAYVAPRTPVEAALAAIWGDVLGLEKVGVHDSFFALGGDSIRSVRAVALAREKGIESTVQQLFKHQTIAELARALESGPAADDELLQLLAEIEALSDGEARERLRDKDQPAIWRDGSP